jgi:hypothetical protein
VLEYLLRLPDNNLPGFDNIGLKETLAIACWDLWWIRRRRTHCMMSVLAITANAAKA